MARGFVINGETMVAVKSSNFAFTNLGLAEGPVTMTFDFRHKDVSLDAWGGEIPNDVQFKLAAVNINMTLIHYDPAVLDACIANSMGGAATVGTVGRAGTLLGGNGIARFATGNYYIGLNLASPVLGKPYCFLYAYLTQQPVSIPLGTEKSLVTCNWRAIPYFTDPWNNGAGAAGVPLWTNVSDS